MFISKKNFEIHLLHHRYRNLEDLAKDLNVNFNSLSIEFSQKDILKYLNNRKINAKRNNNKDQILFINSLVDTTKASFKKAESEMFESVRNNENFDLLYTFKNNEGKSRLDLFNEMYNSCVKDINDDKPSIFGFYLNMNYLFTKIIKHTNYLKSNKRQIKFLASLSSSIEGVEEVLEIVIDTNFGVKIGYCDYINTNYNYSNSFEALRILSQLLEDSFRNAKNLRSTIIKNLK